jgi:uncharacterized RDD family membrane protein YckC
VVTAEPHVTDPKRIKQFAAFFKRYMGISSFVVAALPVPVTMLKLIPVYRDDVGSLSVLTSLSCFLVLAYIFFNRHSLAKTLIQWPRRSVYVSVLGMIVASVALFLGYQFVYLSALDRGFTPDIRIYLMGLYTGFFVLAEGSFVIMATKEYLQDVLGYTDSNLIDLGWRAMASRVDGAVVSPPAVDS